MQQNRRGSIRGFNSAKTRMKKRHREIVQLEQQRQPNEQRSVRPFFFSSLGLPVGFSIPIQRGASDPNYYDSSPLDSVGPFDLPPFSMIPRYLGRAHCVSCWWKGFLVQRIVMAGTTNPGTSLSLSLGTR